MTVKEWQESKTVTEETACICDRKGNKLAVGSHVRILPRDLFDSSRPPVQIELSAPTEVHEVKSLKISATGAFYVTVQSAHGCVNHIVLAHNVEVAK